VRVIVVGGGAVGLCAAESLSSRGAEVWVFERDRCGFGASAGNAGWVTPSLSIPVPGPGVIAASLRWLVKPSGPLWIRPTVSPAMLGWVARFVACCGRPAFQRSLAALQLAAADAGPAFDRLAERGVEFELHDDALLYPAFDRRELEHLHRVVAELRATGARHPFDRVSAGRLVDLEPALDSDVARRLVGGLIAHGERRVRPESLVAGVHSAVRSRRVEVLEHSPATALRRVGPRWLVGCTRSGDAADDP
jgi:D-amino-acid dehydrogenase